MKLDKQMAAQARALAAGRAAGWAAGALHDVLDGLGLDAYLPDQATRLLKLHTPLGDGLLVPEGFHGSETLIPHAASAAPDAAGFQLRVTAVSPRADLDLAALLGRALRLDLLLEDGSHRPFHGHATSLRWLGSDGALARCELVIEPWLAFLARRRDSHVFQDATVMDIVAAVFSDYQGRGGLQPAWRFELADAQAYPRRSLAIQHQETDLAFVLRLLAEEGLFAWFEHEACEDAGLGRHTLVIADHNGALQPFDGVLRDMVAAPAGEQGAGAGRVRYTQAGPTLERDSIQHFAPGQALAARQVALASWDYRALDQRAVVSAAQPPAALQADLVQADQPGAYAYGDREHGLRLACRRREALAAWASRGEAAGTVRRFAPGTWFDLDAHPLSDPARPDALRQAVAAVHHEARSNVGADHLPAQACDGAAGVPVPRPGFVYRNRVELLPLAQPVRAPAGAMAWARRPNAPGVQTALVVGLDAPVHADGGHRIKVQFHWQRGARSSQRLPHPAGCNAPASDAAGTWVRVAESLAGADWGARFTPRLGQEVLVGFIEGDIDRPVVIGSLYNGRGSADAQSNDNPHGAAGSSGSAPAWFPGSERAGRFDGHAHPAALSGVQTQALAASATGGQGHNRLVLDDTPSQGRLTLASSSQRGGVQASHLSIGHLLHQPLNQRLQPRGHGLELCTPHWGALRAGQAMQLSTHARDGGTTTDAGHSMDSREAQARLAQAAGLQSGLARSAVAQGVTTPQLLPVSRGLRATVDSLGARADDDIADGSAAAGGTPSPQRADLLLAGAAGILATTPAHTVAAAGASASLSSERDITLHTQRHAAAASRDGIVFYAAGGAGEPDAAAGITWHSAAGDNSVQAQGGAMHCSAAMRVAIDSSAGSVRIAAPGCVVLGAAGSYLKLEDGDIELGTHGTASFQAAMKELTGPQRSEPPRTSFPRAALNLPHRYSQRLNVAGLIGMDPDTGRVHAQLPYEAYDAAGKLLARGRLDAQGNTQHIYTEQPQKLRLVIGDGEWIKHADTDHGPA